MWTQKRGEFNLEKVRNFLNLNNQQKDYSLFDLTKAENEEIGHLNELDGIDCPICKNKGYILVDDENGVTQSFISCKCMTKRKVKRLSEESGMGELLNYRLKDFKMENEWQKRAVALAIKYIKYDPDKWFCMLGQSGAGKTHICSAICNNLMNNDFAEVRYISWNAFASDYKDNLKAGAEMMRIMQNSPVLYIDDLFKGSTSAYDVKNIAYDLISYRYVNRLRTIISTELMFNEIYALDEAIAGRIRQMCGEYMITISKNKSSNYRLRKETKQ